MQFRNITDRPLEVSTATCVEVVPPGGTVLTAPTLAQPLIDAGELEPVQPKSPRGKRRGQ